MKPKPKINVPFNLQKWPRQRGKPFSSGNALTAKQRKMLERMGK